MDIGGSFVTRGQLLSVGGVNLLLISWVTVRDRRDQWGHMTWWLVRNEKGLVVSGNTRWAGG